jgi:hypothetical protein
MRLARFRCQNQGSNGQQILSNVKKQVEVDVSLCPPFVLKKNNPDKVAAIKDG